MIGDGWTDGPAAPPTLRDPGEPAPRRVAVVTGSRAEFGLLKPVMRAVQAHPRLELLVIAAGSHLIAPAETFRDVKAAFPVADSIPMQVAGRTTRTDDAEALGRGVARFARSFDRLRPDWIVVLGDRIEAFAGAAAASIGGWAVAHLHGGDRAEGIADEAMRHAITKLAHLHLPATERSAGRIIAMGERPAHVIPVGSPAIDGLGSITPLTDGEFQSLHAPDVLVLFHPVGRPPEQEEHAAAEILGALRGERVVAFHPNFDPGREGIMRAIEAAGVRALSHVPRETFVALLKRLASSPRGAIVGNSSAALIECAALGLPAVDVGPRQAGRERASNVVHTRSETRESISAALGAARALPRASIQHPYGDGQSGGRVAAALARIDPHNVAVLRKRCAY
jgi:UDP-hydrolysing UDP-N-acetyl-D-glucosamine 2-epimerase